MKSFPSAFPTSLFCIYSSLVTSLGKTGTNVYSPQSSEEIKERITPKNGLVNQNLLGFHAGKWMIQHSSITEWPNQAWLMKASYIELPGHVSSGSMEVSFSQATITAYVTSIKVFMSFLNPDSSVDFLRLVVFIHFLSLMRFPSPFRKDYFWRKYKKVSKTYLEPAWTKLVICLVFSSFISKWLVSSFPVITFTHEKYLDLLSDACSNIFC